VRVDENKPLSYTIPADAFSDADAGTNFTFSVRLSNGGALPAWLTFNQAQRKFTGTPSPADAGFYDLVITAMDDGTPPSAAIQPLTIEVTAYDDPPSGQDISLVTLEDLPYNYKPEDFRLNDPNDIPPHSLSGVRVTTLPSGGTLTIDGSPAVPGSFARLNPGRAGEIWSPADPAARAWHALASSADGTRLAAVVNGDQIYVSGDGGATWDARASSRAWYGVASSADGMRLAAVVQGGQIYISPDAGITWEAKAFAANWRAIVSSSDGQKLAAIVFGGQIHTSSDGGETWTARDDARSWYGIASSADGTRLAAAVRNGRLFVSADSGMTWTARENQRNWRDVTSSSDGFRLAAIVEGGQIFTTTDSGVTWRPRESARTWFDIASSGDGNTLAAVVQNGQIYVSRNGGAAWHILETARSWRSIAVSADGAKFLAAVNGGQLYKSTPTPAQLLRFVPDADWSGFPSWTFQVEDTGVAGRNLDPTPNFMRLTVYPVNDPPTLAPIPDTPVIRPEDGVRIVHLTGIGAGPGENQELTVTAVSGDPSKIPNPVITYTSPAATGELHFTPQAGAAGSVTITVRVQDSGGVSFSRAFKVFLITPYQQWALDNGLAADPATLGGENLLRFAFGLTPHGSAAGELNVQSSIVAARGGPVLIMDAGGRALLFARRKGSLLTVVPQFSSGLTAWETASVSATVVAEDELVEACRINFPGSLSDGKPPRFVRIAVSSP
jgi:hypothetical protein